MTSNKPLQIFKTGKHTASNGTVLTFTEAQLAACAVAYNAAQNSNPPKYRAPLVLGHPKTDDPAFGWVAALQFNEHGLEATPHQVNPEFAQAVNDGTYGSMSAAFYLADSPTNPTPGILALKHVGFLGAQQPAVKGLRIPAFNEVEQGVVEFNELDFNGYDDRYVAKLFRNIREWFIAEKGIEVADRVLSDWEISSIENAATEEIINDRQTGESKLTPNFNETLLGDTMSVAPVNGITASLSAEAQSESAKDKARLATLEAENAALKQQQADFAEAQTKTRHDAAHAEHLSFAEGLVKSGRLLPAHKDAVVAALNYVSAPAEAVSFGEGEATQPLVEALKATLAAGATLVNFGEHAKAAGDAQGKTEAYDVPRGFTVNTEALEIHNKALSYSEANDCDYLTAVKAVGGQ